MHRPWSCAHTHSWLPQSPSPWDAAPLGSRIMGPQQERQNLSSQSLQAPGDTPGWQHSSSCPGRPGWHRAQARGQSLLALGQSLGAEVMWGPELELRAECPSPQLISKHLGSGKRLTWNVTGLQGATSPGSLGNVSSLLQGMGLQPAVSSNPVSLASLGVQTSAVS